MTTEVRTGEWVLCRGQAIHVTEEEIERAIRTANPGKRRVPRDRMRIVENIALGKRIGTYREWPRSQEEGA
jgi:hypothetical protein